MMNSQEFKGDYYAIIEKKEMSKENFYSTHIFFFPFKWKYKDDKEERKTLDQQMDFNNLVAIVDSDKNWIPKTMPENPTTTVLYNEVSYFHDFARKALYDNGKKDRFLRHFGYDIPDKSQYIINITRKKWIAGIATIEEDIYTLDLDSIILNLYNTGVGVISFHLYNRVENQNHPKAILDINQYGRRIFPPFFSAPLNNIAEPEYFNHNNWMEGIRNAKGIELADSITLKLGNQKEIVEDFTPKQLPPKLGQIPAFISQLLPPKINEKVILKHTIDDRMFALSWYGNKNMSQILKQKVKQDYISDRQIPNFQTCDWWYKFVFVDSDLKTCQDKRLASELVESHTNTRWLDYGTLFGVSRYSFVSLTPPHTDFPLVASHMISMYYKLVEICLVQRACVLRFSDEVSEISKLEPMKSSKDKKVLVEKVNSLYRQYIRFVNKIYFREITAQDQGIELYDLLQEKMRLERDVKDLDGEIQELYQYAMMVEDKNQNKNLERLTVLGTLFVIPSFIVGYFGMNFTKFESIQFPLWAMPIACLIISALGIAYLKTEVKYLKSLWLVLFAIALTILLFTPYM